MFGFLAALACASMVVRAQYLDTFVRLTQYSTDGDGLIAGVEAQGLIFVWTGTEWKRLTGQLVQISIGSKSEIWGVTDGKEVYKTTPEGWQRLPGKMIQVTAAKGGGAVAAIDVNGKPNYWDGAAWQLYPSAPVLKQIEMGKPGNLYGVTPGDEIYRWLPQLKAWKKLRGQLRQISVAADGTIGGTNSANQGWTQPAAAVDSEVNGTPLANAWVQRVNDVKDVQVLSAYTLLARNVAQNLLIQIDTPPPQGAGALALNSTLTVSPTYQADSSIKYKAYAPSKCVLGGSLRLGNAPPASSQTYDALWCVQPKGTFKSVPQPESSPVAPMEVRGIQASLQQHPGSAYAYVASAMPAPTQVCEPMFFRNVSNHSWVEFRLPTGTPGQSIGIPGGAYNKFTGVCNRVWWEDLTFVCDAGSLTWAHTKGKWDADGLCHGVTPSNPYIAYGDR